MPTKATGVYEMAGPPYIDDVGLQGTLGRQLSKKTHSKDIEKIEINKKRKEEKKRNGKITIHSMMEDAGNGPNI